MAEKTTTTTENCNDTTTVVITDASGQTTRTETSTDNQTTTITATEEIPDSCEEFKCPCGDLNLHRLLEQSRCWAFKSSNISAATANGVIIFAMKILQEILIQLCKSEETTLNDIVLVAVAIGELSEVIRVYNPAPFNS